MIKNNNDIHCTNKFEGSLKRLIKGKGLCIIVTLGHFNILLCSLILMNTITYIGYITLTWSEI